MSISFNPPLGREILIDVPAQTQTAHVLFTAQFPDTNAYRNFVNSKQRLQVWSDIPSPTKGVGNWGDVDFQLQADDLAITGSADDISLLPSSNESGGLSANPILSLVLAIPFPPRSECHLTFSFTYRILHPSGEPQWLGSYGHNGSLEIRSSWSTPSSYLSLNGSWKTNKASPSWEPQESRVSSLKIASLDQPDEWKVWGLERNSFVVPELKDCSILFFVPAKKPAGIIAPQLFAVFSDIGTTISYSEGDILASGTAAVTLLPYNSHTSLAAFASEILRGSETQAIRFISAPEHIILASLTDKNPVNALVLPVSSPPTYLNSRLTVVLQTFSDLLQPNSSQFSVYSHENHGVHFFKNDAKYEVDVHVPPSGGSFILSPVHGISNGRHSAANEIELSVLSPTYTVQNPSQAEDILPTPPPSPHLRPIAHLSSLRSDDLNGSNLSISDIGISSRIDTPEANHGAVPVDAAPTIARGGQTEHTVLLKKDLTMASGKGIFPKVKYIFVWLALFYTSMYKKLLLLLGGPARLEVPAISPPVNRANEDPGALSHDDDAVDTEETQAVPVVAQPSPKVIAHSPSFFSHPSPIGFSTSSTSFSIEFAATGKVSFVLRSQDTSLLHKLRIEFNGKMVPHSQSKQLIQGFELVEFDLTALGSAHAGKMVFTLAK